MVANGGVVVTAGIVSERTLAKSGVVVAIKTEERICAEFCIACRQRRAELSANALPRIIKIADALRVFIISPHLLPTLPAFNDILARKLSTVT
ncbi:MAG: hypothetical protein IPG64_11040 [Haliea sp.]|nr:hypothetical protein [Haliea sp.]